MSENVGREWSEEVETRIDAYYRKRLPIYQSIYDCEICKDKDDTIRDLRERIAELESENEELAGAVRDAKNYACFLEENTNRGYAENAVLCNELQRWAEAWDALDRYIDGFDPHTYDFDCIQDNMDDLDPRNKEKG